MTVNLATSYLGLPLRSPLVVGAAAPLSGDGALLPHLEDAGAAAIVLHSLFLEQVGRSSTTVGRECSIVQHTWGQAVQETEATQETRRLLVPPLKSTSTVVMMGRQIRGEGASSCAKWGRIL